MEVSVEISMYPLKEEFELPILEFIAHLKSCQGFETRVNETSTHLFGDMDQIFDALKSGMKASWLKYQKTVFVMKVLGANLKKA